MKNFELEKIIDQLLNSKSFKDYTSNGLQVQGKNTVKKIITGVTACQDLIDYAISVNADAILVHHGYFWKNENPVITHYKYQRIAKLIKHDINLFAYHLPLDLHFELGNNRTIADFLELNNLHYPSSESFVLVGELSTPRSVQELKNLLTKVLGHDILHVGENCPAMVQKIGICTGGGQGFIEEAYFLGCDLYISGEISEQTTHSARELGINYFRIGHHASERYGVQRLGEYLARQYGFDVEYKEVYNPA